MAKILIVVPPLSGHVNPTLGLGAELIRKGYHVTWMNLESNFNDRLPKGGNSYSVIDNIDEWEKEELQNHMDKMIQSNLSYGLESLKFLYEDVLYPLNTYVLSKLLPFIDEFKPDIIISDHQVFAGPVAAITKNTPYVTSVTAPAAIMKNTALPKISEWEVEKIVSFQQENGIPGDKRLDCSEALTLVYTSKLFIGDGEEFPDSYKFIGPIINKRHYQIDFDWEKMEKMGERPKILVSIGTTFDHSEKTKYFKKIVEALKDENVTVVVISDPAIFEEIPENFIIQKQVPQIELMPHMQLVICHGGHNTVCEALWNAVPLIITPIAYDQSYVAGYVTDAEAGIRLNFNRFKANQLKDSVNTILNEKQYNENAKKVQASFHEAGGVGLGAEYIENLL